MAEPVGKAPRFRWKVNNKQKAFGVTDFDKRTITINKKKHEQLGEPLIDTLIHEDEHRRDPDAHENTIKARTKYKMRTYKGKGYRDKFYAKLK